MARAPGSIQQAILTQLGALKRPVATGDVLPDLPGRRTRTTQAALSRALRTLATRGMVKHSKDGRWTIARPRRKAQQGSKERALALRVADLLDRLVGTRPRDNSAFAECFTRANAQYYRRQLADAWWKLRRKITSPERSRGLTR